jgi:hypothetical protein
VAADQPLRLLIDDAQWLDQASAQARPLVVRRLDAESVVVMFGTRDGGAADDLAGLRECSLQSACSTCGWLVWNCSNPV